MKNKENKNNYKKFQYVQIALINICLNCPDEYMFKLP